LRRSVLPSAAGATLCGSGRYVRINGMRRGLPTRTGNLAVDGNPATRRPSGYVRVNGTRRGLPHYGHSLWELGISGG
jgi:hypothetical protein